MNACRFRRREVLVLLAAGALHAALPIRSVRAATDGVQESLAALERRSGGRLGVCVVAGDDPGAAFGHRVEERFALCSTFKLLLGAAVLREAERGMLALDERLAFAGIERVPHSPVTDRHAEQGWMTVAALAEATQTTSDNLAANLLLHRLGGPQALTALLREMGDSVTRIDRIEPAMNLVPAGEVRDTTTPAAMARTVARLFGGELLNPASQAQLRAWMIATRTGQKRLRGGFPDDWIAGDKTGTGISPVMANKYNDVAVVWRAERAPWVVAAYYEADAHYPSMRAQDEAVLAEVGRIVSAGISPSGT